MAGGGGSPICGIIEAQLRAAVGDSAVFAKSPDGAWAHIHDREGLALGVGEALMFPIVRSALSMGRYMPSSSRG